MPGVGETLPVGFGWHGGVAWGKDTRRDRGPPGQGAGLPLMDGAGGDRTLRISTRHRGALLVLLWALSGAAVTAEATETEPAEPDLVETASVGDRAADFGAKAFDVLILRPIGTAATLGGFGCFLLLTPLAAASQGVGTVWDIFVLGPAEYTFERPLGEF